MWDEVRTRAWQPGERPALEGLIEREWLVTNGLGGYASGTISGVATRRYHGLLIAAHPAPLGRVMMVNYLWEYLRLPDYQTIPFGGEEKRKGELLIHGAEHLVEFHLEAGLPVWSYQVGGFHLEKRIYFAHRHNTSYLQYRLLKGNGKTRLKLKPSVHFRGHDDPVSESPGGPYRLTVLDDKYELSDGDHWPTLRMMVHGGGNAGFTARGERTNDIIYRVEERRGYQFEGALWSPGVFRLDLEPARDATLVLSTEPWEGITAIDPGCALDCELERRKRLVDQSAPPAHTGFGAELVLAADQFIFTPAARLADAARAHAHGDEARSVIAGYHWFTDWGRDTMISLEGLALRTGRTADAGYILRTFAQHIQDGLIPNLFPEKGQEGLYNTADATLWYFHALKRFLDATNDRATLTADRVVIPHPCFGIDRLSD